VVHQSMLPSCAVGRCKYQCSCTLTILLPLLRTLLLLLQVALRHVVSVMSPHPQPPCLAVYAAEFAALDVAGTGRLPADALVDLLSSDKWDLTDVEVCAVLRGVPPPPPRGGGGGGGGVGGGGGEQSLVHRRGGRGCKLRLQDDAWLSGCWLIGGT
jgi:hypothetical protein